MTRARVARDHAPARKGFVMDYKASGAPKGSAKAPRHAEHNARGTDKNPFGKTPTKAELVARLKAAAEKKKSDE